MNLAHIAGLFGIHTKAWTQVLRDIRHSAIRACRLAWLVRRALIALALFSLIWGVDQANEYLDNILYACTSQADSCARSLGLRVTVIQALILAISVIWFAYLVRDTALVALKSSSVWSAGRSKYLAIFATWLGAVPLLLFSYRAVTSTGYGNQLSVLPALVGVFFIGTIAQVTLQKASSRSRFGLNGIFIAAITLTSLGVFNSPWDVLLPFAGWLLVTAVLLLLAIEGGCARKYRWWILGLSAAVAFMLTMQLNALGTSLMYRTHRLGVAVAFLLPLSLLPLPTRLSITARQSTVDDSVRQALFWRYFRDMPTHLPPLYVLALVITGVLLYVAGDHPLEFSGYLIAPATLTILLATLGLCYVLSIALMGRAVFWCIVIVTAIVSGRNVAPPAPLNAPEQSFVQGSCAKSDAVCAMPDRIWDRYQRWAAQPGRDRDGPIILVAAAGGGSRAAAHTASSLAAVDAATCGVFGDHIFAISGVSGGAIGGLLYAASRVDAYDLGQRERCRSTKRGERPLGLLNSLLAAASADHLSPLLLRGGTYDLVRSIFAPARIDGAAGQTDFSTRAGTLEMSWHHRYEIFLRAHKLPTTGNALQNEDRLRNDAQPLLVFNATSVQDGHRVLLSYPLLCPKDGWCGQSMSPLADALDSARFPLISPAHARNVFHWNPWLQKETVSERAIVDGGYFDNSGGQTILDIASVLEKHGIPGHRLFALLISSDPDEGFAAKTVPDYTVSGGLTQLVVPVQSLVAVRDGRTAISLNEMQQRLGDCHVIHWSMSLRSLNPLTAEMKASMQTDPVSTAVTALHHSEQWNAEENLRRLERSPALSWALSERSANGVLRLAYGHAAAFEQGSFRYRNERLLASQFYDNRATAQQNLEGNASDKDCASMER